MSHVSAIPFNKAIANDVVSFSSINVDKEDAHNLRNIPGLPCACCGKTMINEDMAKSYTSRYFQGPATFVLKKLRPLAKDFRPTEKTVYNLLKRISQKQPYDDLNKLLNGKYYYHLSRLEAKQLNVINKAVGLRTKLSEKSQLELDKVLVKVREIMFLEAKDERQKRSRIIDEFQNLYKRIPEKDKVKKMIEILQSLPNSSTDIDSFIVKYSQRENREIGQRLITPSTPTLDHIKTAWGGGADDFSNLIVCCQSCNTSRSNTPYKDWLLKHPEMYKHTQRNIDRVIKEINSGRLKNFDNYPREVAKTLYKESGRKMKIDTKALKTKRLSLN